MYRYTQHTGPDPKKKRIALKGKAYSQLRKDLHARAKGLCEICKKVRVPLYVEDYAGDLYFDEFRCGHCSHDKSVGSGGDDTLENTKWACPHCHMVNEHGPRWSRNEVGK